MFFFCAIAPPAEIYHSGGRPPYPCGSSWCSGFSPLSWESLRLRHLRFFIADSYLLIYGVFVWWVPTARRAKRAFEPRTAAPRRV